MSRFVSKLHFFYCMIVLICTIHCNAYSASDLNLIIDSNLSILTRKMILQYAKTNHTHINIEYAKFHEITTKINNEKDVAIFSNLREIPQFIHTNVPFIEEKLAIYKSNNTDINDLSEDDIDLYTLLKKFYIVSMDKDNFAIASNAQDFLEGFALTNYIALKKYSDIVFAIKKGAGIAIAGDLLSTFIKDIEVISEIPSSLYGSKIYNIALIDNYNIENSKSFLRFLTLNRYTIQEYK